MESPDAQLAVDFKALLAAKAEPGRQKEQVIQDFLEKHSELIPTPNLLGHQLHFKTVVSKFPLGTEMTTDYVYLTKNSERWVVTLVELESPGKRIFHADTRSAQFSADFHAALNQVRSWKQFIEDNGDEVTRRLTPLFHPLTMRENNVEFAYQLLYGRSQEKNLTPKRKRQWITLAGETGFTLMTYDQAVDWYLQSWNQPKNILKLVGRQYQFKSMATGPNSMLAYMGPGDLLLMADEKTRLKAQGYDIDAWERGELLIINDKHPRGTKLF